MMSAMMRSKDAFWPLLRSAGTQMLRQQLSDAADAGWVSAAFSAAVGGGAHLTVG